MYKLGEIEFYPLIGVEQWHIAGVTRGHDMFCLFGHIEGPLLTHLIVYSADLSMRYGEATGINSIKDKLKDAIDGHFFLNQKAKDWVFPAHIEKYLRSHL